MIWVDCEMTGLDITKDKLIEIAVVVTDKDLNILAQGKEHVKAQLHVMYVSSKFRSGFLKEMYEDQRRSSSSPTNSFWSNY